MPEFKPPELTDLECQALGIASQIALCQITGIDCEVEASIAVFRKNQYDLLVALTSANCKMGVSIGIQPDFILGMQYDGSGNITTALTKLDVPSKPDQTAPHEDEGNGHRRW